MDLNKASTSYSPAPPSRACTNCARAKAKCVLGYQFGNKCERCNRLNKECQTPSVARKRRALNKTPASRTTRLEEKLDGLVDLLKSAAQSSGALSDNIRASETSLEIRPSTELVQSHASTLIGERSHNPHSIPRPVQNADRRSGSISASGPRVYSPLSTSTASNMELYCTPELYHVIGDSQNCPMKLSFNAAEEYLNIFRNKMLPYLPFIVLPTSISAQEFRQKQPFSWLCIMAVSSRSWSEQIVLKREIRLLLGRDVVLNADGNLDLLLGALVYITWGHCRVQNKPIMTNLIQITTGILYDLGLNKPPLKESTHMMLNYDARGCPKLFSPRRRTIEERRAAVGCFFTSSVISSFFQRIDSMRWNTYLDECLQILDENHEQPSDLLLVQLVRLQLIVENLAQSPWHSAPLDAARSTKAPLIFYLKSLHMQLQDFKQKLPPELQQNEIVLLQFYNTELSVCEVVLSKTLVFPSDSNFHRLEFLYTCLQAAKSWFDHFVALSPAQCVGFSMSIFAHLAHCVVALYRLSTFEDPSWDRSLVRETLNFSTVLEEVVRKVAQIKVVVGSDYGGPEGNDVFSETGRRIGSIKAWWDAKLVEDFARTNNTIADDRPGEVSMEFSDDAWLTDILGFGDYQFDQYV